MSEPSADSPRRHRTVPIPDSIRTVGRGYPDKLCLFKIEASPFWWVRYYSAGKILKKSTKTQLLPAAESFAKKFYEGILLQERNLLPLTSNSSFERCARHLLEEQEHLILRGERSSKMNINDNQKLRADILPYFGALDIRDVSYKHLTGFLAKLSERGLRPSSMKNHLNLVHKILSLAQREGLVDRLPQMPKVKMQDSPRGWFSDSEYLHLRRTVKEMIDRGTVVRYHQITDEMRLLITFMVNSFLRPSDVKHLRHRNVEVVEGRSRYLRIQTEKSKTVNTPVVTMEAAVGIYEDLVRLQRSLGRPVAKGDFVFFPHLANRDFALQTMRRQFDAILEEAGLKISSTGEPRTLYSLRHTAIMFRLTRGDQVDLLTLARNARTSVEMIERFYARPLQAEMNVEKLQSSRKRASRPARKGSKVVRQSTE